MTTFVVGQKVRAKQDIWDPPSDDAPSGCIARKGHVLIVRRLGVTNLWDLYVSHEHMVDKSFGVNEDEIEAMP